MYTVKLNIISAAIIYFNFKHSKRSNVNFNCLTCLHGSYQNVSVGFTLIFPLAYVILGIDVMDYIPAVYPWVYWNLINFIRIYCQLSFRKLYMKFYILLLVYGLHTCENVGCPLEHFIHF